MLFAKFIVLLQVKMFSGKEFKLNGRISENALRKCEIKD